MKIMQAYVTDPRKGGDYRNPYLTLEIDEDLHETGLPVMEDNWRIIPHGPFVAVDQYDGPGTGEWEDADLGVFNTTGLHKHRLVDVVVLTPDEEIDIAMPLDRARRMLRKYEQPWRFVLDDLAGQHGRLTWRLVEQVPHCVKCGRRAVDEVFYRGTHLSLCEADLSAHRKMVRNIRVNS